MIYTKIRSWHVIRQWVTISNGMTVTLCGRTSTGPTADYFPPDEKTCESCLRIARKP